MSMFQEATTEVSSPPQNNIQRIVPLTRTAKKAKSRKLKRIRSKSVAARAKYYVSFNAKLSEFHNFIRHSDKRRSDKKVDNVLSNSFRSLNVSSIRDDINETVQSVDDLHIDSMPIEQDRGKIVPEEAAGKLNVTLRDFSLPKNRYCHVELESMSENGQYIIKKIEKRNLTKSSKHVSNVAHSLDSLSLQ